jgi:hypothetical protein
MQVGALAGEDLRLLKRRADLVLREIDGVRRVFLAVFTGRAPTDPAVLDEIESGTLLHFDAADLCGSGS